MSAAGTAIDATRLRLPILLVVGLLVTGAPVVATWARASAQIEALAGRVERYEQRLAITDETAKKLELRQQRTEDATAVILETVREIREDVKELRRRK